MQLHEIILYVQNMAAQATFYRDVLQLELSWPDQVDNFSDQHWVVFDTGMCKLALHSGGTGQFGHDAPKFVFRSEDLSADRERLLSLGVKLGEIRSPAPGVLVCDGRDPEGNWFSVEQIMSSQDR
jgi:catechol 2,3-dioxygenase-like lactoylglutathione lyase family enzyme